MIATPISGGFDSGNLFRSMTSARNFDAAGRILRIISLIAALAIGTPRLAADQGTGPDGTAPAETRVYVLAKKVYLEARGRWQSDTNNLEAGWKFARACFDCALAATNNADRAKSAEEGIAICRLLIARKPDLAQAHYFLGLNLGEVADTKRNLGGLRIVNEMERELSAARDLDERIDYAGPDRSLGLLYWQAPSVVSIGSRSKARQHLQRAVELAPDFPENRLNLLEAYTKWGDRANAWKELRALEKLWPDARRELSGDEFAADWIDWQKRFNEIKKKYPDADVSLK
jgi:tetratricopeptide (TPR) repeat protein